MKRNSLYDIVSANQGDWVRCPICAVKLTRILPESRAFEMPLYCRHCKRECIVNIEMSPRGRIVIVT